MPSPSGVAAHPDRELLSSYRDALLTWERERGFWPTSQILGAGAIEAVEQAISIAHNARPCMLLPNATYALRLAMATAGVSPATRVVVVEDPWGAGVHCVASLGATSELVTPGAKDWSTERGRGVIVVITDRDDATSELTRIREHSSDTTIIEDAARLHPTCATSPVRHRSGDYLVYSLGPGKPVDAGEGGVLVLPDLGTYERALALSAHPTRLALQHLDQATNPLPMRVHPMSAILAWHKLTQTTHTRPPHLARGERQAAAGVEVCSGT